MDTTSTRQLYARIERDILRGYVELLQRTHEHIEIVKRSHIHDFYMSVRSNFNRERRINQENHLNIIHEDECDDIIVNTKK